MKCTRTITKSILAIITITYFIAGCTRSADRILEEYDEYFIRTSFTMPLYRYEVREFEQDGWIRLETSFYKMAYVTFLDSVSDDCMKEGYIWKYLSTDITQTKVENLEATKKHCQRIAEGHIKYRSRIDSLDYLATMGVLDRDYRYILKGKRYR